MDVCCAASGADGDHGCITCGDVAVAVPILEVGANGLAVVQTDLGPEVVSIALVCAEVGDTVLVHAKEAIAVLDVP